MYIYNKEYIFFIFGRYMKKVYIYVAGIFLLIIWGAVWAQSLTNSLDAQLIELWVIPNNITSLERVSRFEYARLLSTLDCTQCSPAETSFKTEIETWVAWLDPFANNLDDLDLWNMLYKEEDLSYCVAHVAKNKRMTWFPRSTSPLCPGQFCGWNTLVFGDLIQSLFLYSAPYKLETVSIPRTDIWIWIESLGTQIDIWTRVATSQALERCGSTPCAAATFEELDIYARYCQYHLDVCEMRSTNILKENIYPIGHLNLLDDRWVININDDIIQKYSRYDAVTGEDLMDIYLPLIEQAQCSLINDFDDDGIRNSQDSCPYTYSPSQYDTDQDNIGDVCDKDIDGDGVWNQIWAVDDLWNIIIEKWWTHEDNCLRTINPGQEDNNTDTRWDACDEENTNKYIPIQIAVDPKTAIIWTQINATVKTVHEHIERQRWDAWTSIWESATHIYQNQWVYTIIAHAYDPVDEYDAHKLTVTQCPHLQDTNCIISLAKISIIINPSEDLKAALQCSINPKTVRIGEEVILSQIYEWNIDSVLWTIVDTTLEAEPWASVRTSFKDTGLYSIIAQWYTADNQRVALSQCTVEVTNDGSENGRLAEILPDKLFYNTW